MDNVDVMARLLALEYVVAGLLAASTSPEKLEATAQTGRNADAALSPPDGIVLHPATQTIDRYGMSVIARAVGDLAQMAIEHQKLQTEMRGASPDQPKVGEQGEPAKRPRPQRANRRGRGPA
jgi:hypothetical protein